MEKASVMRELVEAVAGPRQWSDTRESWLSRAARRSGLSFRTVKAVWYGEIKDESHSSIRLLRHAALQRTEALASRFETIARGMESADPDFYSAEVLGLINAARALRGLDRTGDDPKD